MNILSSSSNNDVRTYLPILYIWVDLKFKYAYVVRSVLQQNVQFQDELQIETVAPTYEVYQTI